MSRIFSFDKRVLMCNSCGANMEVPVSGGRQTCSKCNHTEDIPPRPAYTSLAEKRSSSVPESERLARLRAQDGKPLIPPKSIAGLLVAGGIVPEWKLDEAISVFLSAKKNVQATGDFAAAEQLRFLELALSNHFHKKGDKERRRAIVESALEALTLPRLKQMMFCTLSRSAALEGDNSSAARWLEPCDPSSDDLEADSAYRLSKAMLSTARGDWSGVHQMLGKKHNDIPIADFMDSLAVALRANATERLGNVEGAVSELEVYMGEGAASGRAAMKSIIEAMQVWHVCELSYTKANEKYAQKAAQKAAAIAGGGVNGAFYTLGSALLLGGLVGVFFLFTGLGPGGLAVMGIPGIILFVVGLLGKRKEKKAAFIRVHGIPATATLVSATPTGMRVNKIPQYLLTMTIKVEGQEPYQARLKLLVNPASTAMLTPGFSIPARVHPEDPKEFILELD